MNETQFKSWIQLDNKPSLVMGIVNVTPDSFSDGGKYIEPEKAVAHGLSLIEEGADILDIGGESTRPGSDIVLVEEELNRVIPVIKGIRKKSNCLISIDSMKHEVVSAALNAGSGMVNDVNGLRSGEMRKVVAERSVPVVIMHMKGSPKTMQIDPTYRNMINDIASFLQNQIDAAVQDGVSSDMIIVDPGIGFGKTPDDNFKLLRRLNTFLSLGKPILVGPSRKSFLGIALDLSEQNRMEGTSAAVTAGILNGANIVRVHDVKEMKRVATIADHIRGIA
ncbi:MAG: dihydropteroate synthase [Candidatus Marinimicrobia bacterium]|jgi:dihydropteroate synthase|nr:dihydropteroate synthase [Candidatus Neomarinimicrobiota bacterium]MBT3618436.1 dihydropteroate synthase [Candidatus Neomarinimicrobiota bacterium]MBT3829008.1 dihydropteroate synthase [Candidatus Neomarinimicrobiota bacterium]MBT3997949.1 dihydropteroate synthase [Candidatus Neomarinimicrobiota bacterium]MBT4280031.1 dihydropteroate synthase [Candidatus Neomarinimicrobiota bacterium]